MPQAFVWPQAQPDDWQSMPAQSAPDAVAIGATRPGLPDPLGLAAVLAPELSRLIGHRIGLRPCAMETAQAAAATTPAAGPSLAEVGRIAIEPTHGHSPTPGHNDATFILALDRQSLSTLLDRMFGARTEPGHAADGLAALPPQSGSWQSLARLLGQAMVAAFQATVPAANPSACFVASARVAPPAEQACDGLRPQDRLLFILDMTGVSGLLSVRRVSPHAASANSKPVEPASPPGTAALSREPGRPGPAASTNWGRRAKDFALDLELPVSVQVGEIPLPIGEVAALRVGDILPLETPSTVSVLVGGQSLATVSAQALAGGRRAADTAGGNAP